MVVVRLVEGERERSRERKCSVLRGRMELPAHESMVGLAMTNRHRNATSGAKGALKCEKSGADVETVG
jgi:hypothetical protein